MSFGNCFNSEAILMFFSSRVAARDLHSLSFLAKLSSSIQFVANDINAYISYRRNDRKKNMKRTVCDMLNDSMGTYLINVHTCLGTDFKECSTIVLSHHLPLLSTSLTLSSISTIHSLCALSLSSAVWALLLDSSMTSTALTTL